MTTQENTRTLQDEAFEHKKGYVKTALENAHISLYQASIDMLGEEEFVFASQLTGVFREVREEMTNARNKVYQSLFAELGRDAVTAAIACLREEERAVYKETGELTLPNGEKFIGYRGIKSDIQS